VDWTFPVSVWDVVMMGRYGRMSFLRMPQAIDRKLVEQSLERRGTYKDRLKSGAKNTRSGDRASIRAGFTKCPCRSRVLAP
jgi:ABC-type cobalamin/Fe3+-siderophores transport system ATPase subunit